MNNQDIDEVAKYKKKKNNSSRSEKKADHRHEYEDCIVSYTYDWADRHYTCRERYCVICGKINEHRKFNESFTDHYIDSSLNGDESSFREKYPDLPVFHLNKYTDGYVNLQEAQ
jgi:hypothetical protein